MPWMINDGKSEILSWSGIVQIEGGRWGNAQKYDPNQLKQCKSTIKSYFLYGY